MFPDDAEDIKSHRWFRDVAWDRVQNIAPPFTPQLTSQDDTQYFNESEPLEEFSNTCPSVYATPEAIEKVLRGFSPVMQGMAEHLVAEPYDPSMLRRMDIEIDTSDLLSASEKLALKQFVRSYGRKVRKRPRDRLLRDKKLRDIVMDVRKTSTFAGYTWRRMRPGAYTLPARPGIGI